MPEGLSAILLPGLDGTGRLFAPLLKERANDLQAKVASYPTDAILDYAALEQLVEAALPKDLPFIVVAESFSGPLAIKLAAQRVTGLIGLVLLERAPQALTIDVTAEFLRVLSHAVPAGNTRSLDWGAYGPRFATIAD